MIQPTNLNFITKMIPFTIPSTPFFHAFFGFEEFIARIVLKGLSPVRGDLFLEQSCLYVSQQGNCLQ